ncbi:hypothetical protein MT390_08155 [Vibrio sp. 2-Bac 85]
MINIKDDTKKTNLVFFYSEGAPFDNALDLKENKDLVLKYAQGHVDEISAYNPRRLKELGYEKYVKEYDSTGLVTLNAGMSKIGFSAWNPLIMLLELEKMNDGDVLIYRDANIKKYEQLADYEQIREIANTCLEICSFDFFIANHDHPVKNREITKTNVLRELGEGHEFSFEFPTLHANFIIVRKSDISIALLQEWLTACENEEWINGEQYGELDEQFSHSTSEQAILSVIISNWIRKRKHMIPLQYPFISFQGRNIKKIKFTCDFSHLSLIKTGPYEIVSPPAYTRKLNFNNLCLYCGAFVKNWFDRKAYRFFKSMYSLNNGNKSLKKKMLGYKHKIGKC